MRLDDGLGEETKMGFPYNKTKIVCTIGPASSSRETMERMLLAGMNVARLNFSHGEFEGHAKVIEDLRAASRSVEKRLTIMADLPGPKIRLGEIAGEPIELKMGDNFTLTTRQIKGDGHRASVTFAGLAKAVRPDDVLFLNDGLIQMEVESVHGHEVACRVVVGGELRSRKGLNLPGIELGTAAFTDHDRKCLEFALNQGVNAVSQSFVESKADILALRKAAADLGYSPFVIAKIERSKALDRIEEILEAADGIMIARGDFSVEIPIERIAVVQKELVHKANLHAKPVITATQMLDMTGNRRPEGRGDRRGQRHTRRHRLRDALRGVGHGKYPVDAVAMLAKIAQAVKPNLPGRYVRETLESIASGEKISTGDLISLSVESALERMPVAGVIVRSRSGATARRLSRLRLPVWISAISRLETTCEALQFSYGVFPVHAVEDGNDWSDWTKSWLNAHEAKGEFALLIQGPSLKHPEANHRLEIIDLKSKP